MSDLLDEEPYFGKHAGTGLTWREVVEKDPDYVEWVVAEAKAISEELRFELMEALEDYRSEDYAF